MAIPILGNEFWMSPTMGGVNSSTAVGLMAQQGAELSKKIEIDSQKNEAKAKAPAIGQIYQQAYERIASGDTGGFADLSLAGAMTTGNPFLMAMHKDVTDVAGHLSQQFMQRSLQKERMDLEEKLFNSRMGAGFAEKGMMIDAKEREGAISRNAKLTAQYNKDLSDYNFAVSQGVTGLAQPKEPALEDVPEEVDFSAPLFGASGEVIPRAKAAGGTVEPPLPEPEIVESGSATNIPPQKVGTTQAVGGEDMPAGYDIASTNDVIIRAVVANPQDTQGSISIPVGRAKITKKIGEKGPTKAEVEKVHSTMSELESNNPNELNWFASKIAQGGAGEGPVKQLGKASFIEEGDKTYKMYYGRDLYGEKVWRKEEKGNKVSELSDAEYQRTKPPDVWKQYEKPILVNKEFVDRFNNFKEAGVKGLVEFVPRPNDRPLKTPEQIDTAKAKVIESIIGGNDTLDSGNLALQSLAGRHVKITKSDVDSAKSKMESSAIEQRASKEIEKEGFDKPGTAAGKSNIEVEKKEKLERKEKVMDELREEREKFKNIPKAEIHYERAKNIKKKILQLEKELESLPSASILSTQFSPMFGL